MLLSSLALAGSLDTLRIELSSQPRPAARELARDALSRTFRDELAPAWFGTPWAFYGTSTEPRKGTIACGYFVSTLLEDLGLRVERVHMAQQASEYIVKTFADESQLRRFRTGDEDTVVNWVLSQPDGLYTVGLDFHVGMLVKRAETVEFCHSSYLGETVVMCTDPRKDPAFQSQYHVVGPVLTDVVVDAWIDGQELRTFRP